LGFFSCFAVVLLGLAAMRNYNIQGHVRNQSLDVKVANRKDNYLWQQGS